MHTAASSSKYSVDLHSSQLERCWLGRLPAEYAAQCLPLGDTSTLADPSVVDTLIKLVAKASK